MSVKDGMNTWARKYVNKVYSSVPVPEGTEFTFEEEAPSLHYCETCGPDPYPTNIRWAQDGQLKKVRYYGTLGDIIQDILASEKEENA